VATPLSPAAEATIARFERGIDAPRTSFLSPAASGATPAVGTFIALNVIMFLVESLMGGPTNLVTLYRLGALEPLSVLGNGQYWRLFTALFLHYGALHLIFNAYALYVLGPSLEVSIGSWRFAGAYLISGIGSSAGVVALWRLGWTQADFLVGASGCVLGIVGVWAGLLLRQRRTQLARRRLATIGIIVAVQTAFDLYTPQISMAAHLCGLGTGLIVGLLLGSKTAEV
jgi:rhomboid protease GluP